MDKAQIKEWYGNGLTDAQLDGKGAETGSTYAARNYVALGVITQAEADAIRAANEPEAETEPGAEALHILEDGTLSASSARTARKASKK